MTKAHRHKGKEKIRAVLFDFDGTLTVPGLIDFMAIKKEIGCPISTPILEFIASLPSARLKRSANAILERFEDKASEAARLNEGAEDLVLFLKGRGIRLGIITRNRLKSVMISMGCFRKITARDFDVIVTRENSGKLKPHPDGVHFAARKLRLNPKDMVVVGDYIFDIEAGRRAGALTAFIESEHTTKWPDPPADWTIRSLVELKGKIRGK